MDQRLFFISRLNNKFSQNIWLQKFPNKITKSLLKVVIDALLGAENIVNWVIKPSTLAIPLKTHEQCHKLSLVEYEM